MGGFSANGMHMSGGSDGYNRHHINGHNRYNNMGSGTRMYRGNHMDNYCQMGSGMVDGNHMYGNKYNQGQSNMYNYKDRQNDNYMRNYTDNNSDLVQENSKWFAPQNA